MTNTNNQVVRCYLSEQEIQSGGGFLHQFSVTETYQLHNHSFYELFLVSKGMATHCINGSTQLLTEGSFVLIRPNDVHKYEFFNQYDFELINIGFPIDLFLSARALTLCPDDFFDEPELSPHIVLEGYNFTDIKRKMIHFDKKPEGALRRRYLSSILPFLLYRFLAEPDINSKSNLVPSWLSRLIDQMNRPECFIEGLPCLLRLANMSQEHLTREFHKHLNLTPTEFINTKRMNYAIKLLLESDLEIIDICHECGFNNLSYFYRIFQKQFECSPKKFLERYHNRN